MTNETVFACDRLPACLLVIGGGPVGTELAQAFSRLGSRVIIASVSEHILPREDADVAAVLAQQLRQEGVAEQLPSHLADWILKDAKERALLEAVTAMSVAQEG